MPLTRELQIDAIADMLLMYFRLNPNPDDDGWRDVLVQELDRAWDSGLADVPHCPQCKTGVSSVEAGGSPTCFHCGSCGYVACAYDEEKAIAETRETCAKAAGNCRRTGIGLWEPSEDYIDGWNAAVAEAVVAIRALGKEEGHAE